MNKKYSMFWNWLRWQCLNKRAYEEVPAGTIIDDDDFMLQMIKLIKQERERR